MLRRLHPEQPESFAFTPENLAWAEAQITKYPEGREASAVIPLLWRAQEQEGWVSKPAIEEVARMLGMAEIRVLEVATFYFMFQLQPVGEVAHIQVCGTTSCMICGAEDLIAVCRDKLAPEPHQLSEDGKLSWEEVECLGACANAPMAQIGKDYYEDLTAERFAEMIDAFRAGEVPTPGPQTGRWASEPADGLTSLDSDRAEGANASVALAGALGDTVKRIDGTEVPLLAPWGRANAADADTEVAARDPLSGPKGPDASGKTDRGRGAASDGKSEVPGEAADAKPAATAVARPAPAPAAPPPAADRTVPEAEPERLDGPRGGAADDLKRIKGVGPQLEGLLNSMGFWHFDQIAAWGPGEIAWVDNRLKFKGRIVRDNWVDQARALASEG